MRLILGFAIFLSSFFIPWSVTAQLTPSPTTYPHCQPLGDVNCDGRVNVDDIILIARAYGRSGSLAEDLDNNSRVSIADLVLLLRFWGGMVTYTPSPSTCQHIIIPGYIYSGDNTNWNNAISGAPTVRYIIVNQNEGPGSTLDHNFQTRLNQMRAAGIVPVGYVDSNYTAIPLTSAYGVIDSWDRMYDVKDIFIDQVTNDDNSAHINYYSSLANYILARRSDAVIIWNPGTTFVNASTAASYLNLPGIWTIFESDYSSYNTFTFPSWIWNYPKERFYHLVYGANQTQMSVAVNKAKSNNAGYVYVTNDVLPNPWDTIPTYFTSEISTVNIDCNILPVTTLTATTVPTLTSSLTLAPTPTRTPTPTIGNNPTSMVNRLRSVNTWLYQLSNYNMNQLINRANGFDLAVIDLAKDGASTYFTFSEVQNIKNSGKILLAYFEIGALENYRPEWNNINTNHSDLLLGTVSGWPSERYVKYWDQRWWNLVVKGRVDQALQAGFDGVYLDMVVTYEEIPANSAGTNRNDLAQKMVDLIARLSYYAKYESSYARPNFYIFPQNAPELRTYNGYINAIDGIGMEELYVLATNNFCTASWCQENRDNAEAIKNAGKLVLTIDYATTASYIQSAYNQSRSAGFVPYVSVRELDTCYLSQPGPSYTNLQVCN